MAARVRPEGRPDRFVEDAEWLPSDDAFAVYPPETDLGLLFTDGTYDVLMFEALGPAALDALEGVDGFRAPDVQRRDLDAPLLVLSRRGEDVNFSAVRTWPEVERLTARDGRRRSPLGWAVVLALALAAMALGGAAGLRFVDADGPVTYSVVNESTAANPFPVDARLAFDSGGVDHDLIIATRRISGPAPVLNVRWRLGAPLTVVYVPGGRLDEGHRVTLDIRAEGTTALDRGEPVNVGLVVTDDTVVLTVEQPRTTWRGSGRIVVHRAVLVRARPAADAGAPSLLNPVDSGCIREEIDRFLLIRDAFDMGAAVRRIEDELTDRGRASFPPNDLIARRIRDLRSETDQFIESSGLGPTRPPGSLLATNLELHLRSVDRLADAWASAPDGSPEQALRISVLLEQVSSSSASFVGRFEGLLEQDARAICAR